MADRIKTDRGDLIGIFALLALSAVLTACGAIGNKPATYSIGYRIQTGLIGLTYQVKFLRSGEASLSCTFYDLRDGRPRMDARSICDDLWNSDRSRFQPEGNGLKADFSAEFDPSEIDAMEKLLDDHGYFQMDEKFAFDGRLDAPPSFINVETGGKKRSVPSNERHQEGHTAIIQSLVASTNKLEWR